MSFYLASMEVWRSRGRYFLFGLVIALITTLVLFIAGLAQGLSNANREYISKLDAQLIAFQDKVQLSTSASQISQSVLNNIRRVDGVEDIGSISLSSGSVAIFSSADEVDISLIGVEPGRPGMPIIKTGKQLRLSNENNAIVDSNFLSKTGYQVGDKIRIKTLQGKEYEYNEVTIIGSTDGQDYLFRPSIFLPYLSWDKVRPKSGNRPNTGEYTFNIIAIKTTDSFSKEQVAGNIQAQVKGLEVVDLDTAIRAIPGYLVQQQTLNTQQGFTLLIGVLVIGGFFQIQMLQKIPLIGVLKAIGTSNNIVAASVVIQIILVSTFGVLLGTAITLLLSLALPPAVPIIFSGPTVLVAVAALLAIGPLGGLVTVRLAVSVEPLTALGLSS